MSIRQCLPLQTTNTGFMIETQTHSTLKLTDSQISILAANKCTRHIKENTNRISYTLKNNLYTIK